MASQEAIIKQIDDILARHAQDFSYHYPTELSESRNALLSAIRRLAPPGSVYADNVQRYDASVAAGSLAMSMALGPVRGMLRALRSDYASGYMQSVVELVHADIFADFLDMASYLLEQGYKDPAAVVTGSVLEAHLRKLCVKLGVLAVKADGTPKKADALNAELTAAGAYSKLDHKNVTAWLDLRNKAAHGHYGEYTQEQVALMLQGVRDFASRHPA